MNNLFPFLTASILTLICCLLIPTVFSRFKLMDKPKKYGLNRQPIPYSVGIVLYIIFCSLSLYFVPITYELIGFLIAAGLIVVVSFIDDFYPLPAVFRLFIQVLAGIIVIYSGIGIHSLSNPLGAPFSLDSYISVFNNFEIIWIADFFTIIWIVVLINSVNWLDGVNGLASGVGVIAAVILFLLSVQTNNIINQEPVIIMSSILAGIYLVFVCFDFYPAKMLMGDSGSMFLGFSLAILSIFAGGKVATAFLILGFPLLDAFWVIIQRLLKKSSPLKGKDRLHLHDKLMDYGFSMRQILLLIYLLVLIFGLSAIFLGPLGKLISVSIMIVMMIVMTTLLWTAKTR